MMVMWRLFLLFLVIITLAITIIFEENDKIEKLEEQEL